ncbi:DUF4097 family beta strand repeat-containing protein [Paenibacillus arenosi]|uniref:DUF4097 family beta strand repeat protein n=1 Tax=Paenibacillus arenosi TaxID=2774142 RepID=A0ABR9B1L5_9BACL|nr:DUF4097 family beta strand repeat-containing protein [Paenibacillus arenosi]MBD8499804.1 DUF4097 family beta strand repeat protein [Paenibacillus arenosi]
MSASKKVKVALVLIVIAVIGNTALYLLGVSPFNTTEISERWSANSQEIQNIQVISDTQNIELTPTKGETIEAKLTGTITTRWADDYELQVSHSGKNVVISVKEKTAEKFFVLYSNVKLTIQIPQQVFAQLQIQTDTGNISIEEVHAIEYQIASNTGNFLANVNDGKFNVSTDTGEVSLHLKKITSDIFVKTDTGNVSVTAYEIPNSLQHELKTVDGSVESNLPPSIASNSNKTPRVRLVSDTGNLVFTQR